jgi:hypothetical protein
MSSYECTKEEYMQLIRANLSTYYLSNTGVVGNSMIQTDQELIEIEKLDDAIHTIHGKPIRKIIKTISTTDCLMCIQKNGIDDNEPSQPTLMAYEQKLVENNKSVFAITLCKMYKRKNVIEPINIQRVKYNGELLYSIVMDDVEQVKINNMIFETLHYDHYLLMLHGMLHYLDDQNKEKIIKMWNDSILNDRLFNPKSCVMTKENDFKNIFSETMKEYLLSNIFRK